MERIEANKDLIDSYFKLLHGLSTNHKLDLISRLTESIKNEVSTKKSFYKAFGAWNDNISTKELALELRKSRKLKRRIENF
jgi:arsenate reductase-like glutaredoxin family protein